MAATWEVLGDEQLAPSSNGIIVSAPPAASDDEGGWDFGDMPADTSTGHEQRLVVLDNIQGWVRLSGLPAPNNGLDVLCLAECGLCDRLLLIELCCMM